MGNRHLMNKPQLPSITTSHSLHPHSISHTLHVHTLRSNPGRAFACTRTAWQINVWFWNQEGKKGYFVSLGFHLLPSYIYNTLIPVWKKQVQPPSTPPQPLNNTCTHLLIKSEAVGLFCVCGYACNVSVWSVKTDLMEQCPQLSLIRLQQVSPPTLSMIDSSQVSRPSFGLLEGGR